VTRRLLIFVVLMPLLNFTHEAGHWVGYKLCQVPVTMRFQRVEVQEKSTSRIVNVIGNWSGPTVNFLIAGISLIYPQQLAIVGFSAISQRLAAQMFGLPLYCAGKTKFSNDETILFPEEIRLFVCLLFIFAYGVWSFKFCQALGFTRVSLRVSAVIIGGMFWIVYGLMLMRLDKILI